MSPLPRRQRLYPGQLLSLSRLQGWTLVCCQGPLLISGPPPLGDRELGTGESLILPSRALYLVEAWAAGEILLLAPARKERPAFGWVFSPRWAGLFPRFQAKSPRGREPGSGTGPAALPQPQPATTSAKTWR